MTNVVIDGAQRVKAGEAYTYTATAYTADGAVVTRPMTWSLADPSSGTITSAGVLTASRSGTVTIRVTIGGQAWTENAMAYDWESFGSYPTLGLSLEAHTPITNKYGTSEYASLVIGCLPEPVVWPDFFTTVRRTYLQPRVVHNRSTAQLSIENGPIFDKWILRDDNLLSSQ